MGLCGGYLNGIYRMDLYAFRWDWSRSNWLCFRFNLSCNNFIDPLKKQKRENQLKKV